MKNLMVIILLNIISVNVNAAKDTSNYPTPDYKKIKTVYKVKIKIEKSTVLKIYEDNLYEYIEYNNDYPRVSCKKELGKYTILKNKLILTKPFIADSSIEFKLKDSYYIGKNGLHTRWIDYIKKNRPDIPKYKTDDYQFPWFFKSPYLLINSDEIIGEKDILIMMEYVLRNQKSEKDKVKAISEFMVSNIDYGSAEDGESNYERILFGKKNNAVCEGYSRTFVSLCSLVGIDAKYVSGPVRTGFSDALFTYTNHAWNQVKIINKWYVVDVTWMEADDFWFLPNYDDFTLSHIEEKKENRLDSITIDDFSSSLIIYPVKNGSYTRALELSVKESFQYCKDSFIIKFPLSFQASNILKYNSEKMFTQFKNEKTSFKNNSEKINYKLSKNKLEQTLTIYLKDTLNNITINIKGIGTIHFMIVNGTKNELAKYLIDHVNNKSIMSFTYALMSSLILKDKKAYEKLTNEKTVLSYKNALAKFEKNQLPNWDFKIFGCASHFSYHEDERFEKHSMEVTRAGFNIEILKNKNGEYFFYDFDFYSFPDFAKN